MSDSTIPCVRMVPGQVAVEAPQRPRPGSFVSAPVTAPGYETGSIR